MSAVEVDIAEEIGGAEAGPPPEQDRAGRKGRRRAVEPVEVEIEREITKRQLIQSISSIVVVILYMVFTLLRDRDAGVVVIDPDESTDDWDES